MAVILTMAPIPAGKEKAVRELASAMMGSQREGFLKEAASASTVRETWAIQESPSGSYLLSWLDADLEKYFGDIIDGNLSEYQIWFAGQLKEAMGFDLHEAPTAKYPEIILDYKGQPNDTTAQDGATHSIFVDSGADLIAVRRLGEVRQAA